MLKFSYEQPGILYPMQELNHLELDQVKNIINRIRFFDHFCSHEIEMLANKHGKFFLADSGEMIVKQGEESCSLYVLLSGLVHVSKDEQQELLAVLAPGEIFGEISFLTARQRISSCIAEQKSIIMQIDQSFLDNIDAVIRDKIKDQIIIKLIQRLEAMNNRYSLG